MLRIHSHAKINLYLDVLNRRRDGFTNIETIFQTVSLADVMTFETRASGISMECSRPEVPTDESNLIVRAARLLQESTGSTAGAHVRLDKRIPMAAGLAGGSGNGAAALVALNQLWALGLSMPRLERLAARLGSDVPYCIRGGTVAATGRGERMTPLPSIGETWFVLLHPDLHVSTRDVYTSEHLARNVENSFAGRTPAFRKAIDQVLRGDIANALFNRMETAAFQMHPELAALKQRLVSAGCSAAIMSGSGPTVFGPCSSRGDAESVAARMAGIRTSVVQSVESAISGLPVLERGRTRTNTDEHGRTETI
jgi:4-diphosphocytidyl-2-C-methyl-D-erythritol kinase